MRKYAIWFSLLVIVMCSCQDKEADAPELLTKQAQQIGTSSAVFEAELVEVGPVRPVLIGFLWDSQPDISIGTASQKFVLGPASDPRLFSINVGNLVPATTYYYRSFAANSNYTLLYYGQVVSFTTLP